MQKMSESDPEEDVWALVNRSGDGNSWKGNDPYEKVLLYIFNYCALDIPSSRINESEVQA